jgi:archaellum component FlaC
MIDAKSITIGTNNVEQDLVFEVSKEVRVVTKVTYKKDDFIQQLRSEIDDLRQQVQELKKEKILTTKESLVELWDNDYDERWNNC